MPSGSGSCLTVLVLFVMCSFLGLQQSYGTDGGDPNARVDLKKMTVQALRKYTKVYELPNVHPQSSKQELETAVEKHWNMMNVTEDGVVQNLMRLRSKQY